LLRELTGQEDADENILDRIIQRQSGDLSISRLPAWRAKASLWKRILSDLAIGQYYSPF
jgi:hypothetical protein